MVVWGINDKKGPSMAVKSWREFEMCLPQYPCRDLNAGHRLRRPMLYPSELQGRKLKNK